MYAWLATKWAYGKDEGLFSRIAKRAREADIEKNDWDEDPAVNLAIIILGILGF